MFGTTLLAAAALCAENIPVLHREGTQRGFLELTDASGRRIADGELTQSGRGSQMFSRLVFRFRDGSIDDESSVFTQAGTFRLVHDHHMQKGPSFPKPIDVEVDMAAQSVKTITEKDGKSEVSTEHVELPEDLANGLPMILVKNIAAATPQAKVAYLASGSKPRMVHLAISSCDPGHFSVGGRRFQAACFLVHVELGGVAGVIAPIIGKEPADSRVWVLEGAAPAFIRAELTLYEGGPMWTIQMTNPVWRGSGH